MNFKFQPAKYFPFLRWGKNLTKQTIRVDLLAGLTGAAIVLPQGVAFAAIAGMPPEYGLGQYRECDKPRQKRARRSA